MVIIKITKTRLTEPVLSDLFCRILVMSLVWHSVLDLAAINLICVYFRDLLGKHLEKQYVVH